MDIKKKRTLIIIGIFIVVLSLVEFSYALWKITWNQSDENIVNLDCFKISFAEVTGSAVKMQNTFPLTNEEGKKLTPYHFTIKNECESRASYTIQLESKDTSTLDEDYLKTMLNENEPKLTSELDEGKLTKNLGTNKAYVLETGTLNASDTKEYDFRVWLDESVTKDTPNIQEEKWSGIITLNTSYKPPINTKGMLRKIDAFDEDISLEDISNKRFDREGMWQYSEKVEKIIIENKINPPENYVKEFDESVNDDKSVMSYLVPTDEYTDEDSYEGNYIAYLQADGGVIANPDSSYLFYNFGYVTEIEGLENLDTSNVTNMSHMFAMISYYYNDYWGFYMIKSSLSNLDLKNMNTSSVIDMNNMFNGLSIIDLNLGENFDTSQVTNMSHMFESVFLNTIDFGNKFNTSNVTDMSYMFSEMTSLTTLNLPDSFDTSKVTNMSHMFYYTNSLLTLTLGDNFDTSKVTDMNSMFAEILSLTTLDLGEKFDTSNVTNMEEMFYEMRNLNTLDLSKSNFDTSQVTDMSGMFSDMYALTTLDLGESFNTSQVTDMYRMFYHMKTLTTLTLGEWFDTSQVTDMSAMFAFDSSLNSIEYGSLFVHKDGANISGMFLNCPNELPKPDSNTNESWAGVDWNE